MKYSYKDAVKGVTCKLLCKCFGLGVRSWKDTSGAWLQLGHIALEIMGCPMVSRSLQTRGVQAVLQASKQLSAGGTQGQLEAICTPASSGLYFYVVKITQHHKPCS